MLNSEPNDEVCDTTDEDSSTGAEYIVQDSSYVGMTIQKSPNDCRGFEYGFPFLFFLSILF
ncbi:MAG: hypothetical protein ABIT35_09750 [Chitinophagaceae bacterium]